MQEEIIQKLKSLVNQVKDISSDYDIEISINTTAASDENSEYEGFSIGTIEQENYVHTFSFDGGRTWETWEPMKEEEE